MLQIFRVEHAKTRQGPFQTIDEFTQELAAKANTNPRLKSPGDDGLPLGLIPWSFVFGCLNLETLKQWFLLGESTADNEHIIHTLKSKGFQLVEYLVERDDYLVSQSGVQVAFSTSEAREDGLTQHHDLAVLL
jgi:hypothetical protein